MDDESIYFATKIDNLDPFLLDNNNSFIRVGISLSPSLDKDFGVDRKEVWDDMAKGARKAIRSINESGGLFGNKLKLNRFGKAARKSDLHLSLSEAGDSWLSVSLSRSTRDAVTGLTTTLSDTAYQFNYSGEMQYWTVPGSGTYSITALGALGGGFIPPGTEYSYPGGLGALVGATFDAPAETTLQILAGGAGTPSTAVSDIGDEGLAPDYGSGGGGGTFVVALTDEGPVPLLVAGGGGGEGSSVNGFNASLTPDGTSPFGYTGGTNGSGGTIGVDSNYYGGAGGGGFISGDDGNGGSHYNKKGDTLLAQGGFSFLNGGQGGSSSSVDLYPGAPGGFGGGGGGGGNGAGDDNSFGGGGGGGGYSGGGGGYDQDASAGGGGGTYINPNNVDILTPAQIPAYSQWQQTGGNGGVVISLLDTVTTSSRYSVQLNAARSGSRWRQKGSVQASLPIFR